MVLKSVDPHHVPSDGAKSELTPFVLCVFFVVQQRNGRLGAYLRTVPLSLPESAFKMCCKVFSSSFDLTLAYPTARNPALIIMKHRNNSTVRCMG